MTDSTTIAGAWGVGLATITDGGQVLDTWYPSPALGDGGAPGTTHLEPATASGRGLGVDVGALCGPDPARAVDRVAVLTAIASLADPPVDAHDAYLRLHLLSHRLVRPHG